jgi:NAD+ kinase
LRGVGMKKIAVIGVSKKKEIDGFIKSLDSLVKKYSIVVEKFIYSNKDFHLYDRLSENKTSTEDYIAAVSIGGDGTFLYTSRIFAGTDIPVFGVNLGHLGFNTNIETKEFRHYFESFMEGVAQYDQKALLDVEIENQKEIYSVLNEGVISHTGISRMIRLNVEVEGQSICDFRGDGLIVSSPTGSTAYNLSAGGPILHPSLEAFAICPICPHTLAIRPLIVPFNRIIQISVEESLAKPQLTLDGQKIILLDIGQKIAFRKSPKKVKVVKSSRNFPDVLKLKLGWMV